MLVEAILGWGWPFEEGAKGEDVQDEEGEGKGSLVSNVPVRTLITKQTIGRRI